MQGIGSDRRPTNVGSGRSIGQTKADAVYHTIYHILKHDVSHTKVRGPLYTQSHVEDIWVRVRVRVKNIPM
jgi:hypothetical protein